MSEQYELREKIHSSNIRYFDNLMCDCEHRLYARSEINEARCLNVFLDSKGPFTQRASERCSNATNAKIRPLYILMMYSHWRVTTRAKSIATVIARIGHVSNLTTHL